MEDRMFITISTALSTASPPPKKNRLRNNYNFLNASLAILLTVITMLRKVRDPQSYQIFKTWL